ncbi:hypothetical protein G6F57_017679 [Rhizopus arrhizus]|nr:hypothetical protein G6F57_017679 [Rhizopus arrhizus]
MADDRTALLRQAGQVQHRGRQAFQVRGHRHDGADGDDAGAAHARDEQAVGAVKRGRGRQRQLFDQALQAFLVGLGRRALPGLAAHDGHEAGAEALQTGEVLVAAGLVDGTLAAEFGFQRLHRQAMRLLRTIAAAFADAFVDDDAARRVRIGVALAAAALFGGTGLVVDQHRHARVLAQSVTSLYLSGSSVTTTILSMPSAAIWRLIIGTLIGPSTGCPPVMATASLNRIL